MSIRSNCFWLLGFVFGCSGAVSVPVAAPSLGTEAVGQRDPLPIRKIRIFEAGFAQFERVGHASSGAISLRVRQAQIDDVLKSLTVYSNEVRVPFLADFTSIMLEQRARSIAALPVTSENGLEFIDLVRSLIGEEVELAVGQRTVKGRLVQGAPLESQESAQAAATADDKPAPPPLNLMQYELTLLTETTGIERFRSKDVRWLRPLAAEIASQLDQAIRSTAQRNDKVARELRIQPSEKANLRISYVSEVPIFRPTYRIDLKAGEKSTTLTGQVLLHNDGNEDWRAVELTLTNDESDSFVVPLASPRFWERRLKVSTQGRAAPIPQLAQSTADHLADQVPVGEPQLQQAHEQAAASLTRNRLMEPASRPHLPTEAALKQTAGRSRYAYTIDVPVTIPAGTSALVPMPSAAIHVETGVWFTPRIGPGRSVVHIKNSAAAPIPAGLLSVFEHGQFRGELDLPQLEPDRSGYFDYGTALGLEIARYEIESATSKPIGVTWKDDALDVRRAERQERHIHLVNRNGEPTTAFMALGSLDHPVVHGADRFEIQSNASSIVVALSIPGHREETRNLVVESEAATSSPIDSLELATIDSLIDAAWGNPAQRKMLRAARKLLSDRQAAMSRKEAIELAIAQVEEDSQRLNLGDATNLTAANPAATRFIQLEVRRDRLKQETTRLGQVVEDKNTALRACFAKLEG